MTTRRETSAKVIEKREDLAGCIGQTITLRGIVSRTKIPEILGVEVDVPYEQSEQVVEVTGVLDVYEVPANIDANGLRSAHKNPGAHYRLRPVR